MCGGEVLSQLRDFVVVAALQRGGLFERGAIEQRVVHDEARVEQRRVEREQEALAQRYAVYAQSTDTPVTFEQFAVIMRQMTE